MEEKPIWVYGRRHDTRFNSKFSGRETKAFTGLHCISLANLFTVVDCGESKMHRMPAPSRGTTLLASPSARDIQLGCCDNMRLCMFIYFPKNRLK